MGVEKGGGCKLCRRVAVVCVGEGGKGRAAGICYVRGPGVTQLLWGGR